MPYKNKEDQKECWRRHYARNKQRYVEKSQRQKTEIRQFIWEVKLSNSCVDCGEADPLVLDFDHMGDKEFTIGLMVNQTGSFNKVLSEMEKCQVRCSNCHRRRSVQESWVFQGF